MAEGWVMVNVQVGVSSILSHGTVSWFGVVVIVAIFVHVYSRFSV